MVTFYYQGSNASFIIWTLPKAYKLKDPSHWLRALCPKLVYSNPLHSLYFTLRARVNFIMFTMLTSCLIGLHANPLSKSRSKSWATSWAIHMLASVHPQAVCPPCSSHDYMNQQPIYYNWLVFSPLRMSPLSTPDSHQDHVIVQPTRSHSLVTFPNEDAKYILSPNIRNHLSTRLIVIGLNKHFSST